jgi:hypothetical protein
LEKVVPAYKALLCWRRARLVLYQTEEEYCTVIGFTAQSRISTNINIPVTDHDSIDKLGKLLESFNIRKGKPERINIEKQRLYQKTSAKVFYTISICIDILDKDFIFEFATIKEK